MKKIIEKLKDRYYRNVIICIIVALILFTIPIFIIQKQNSNVLHVENLYATKSTKYVTDKVTLFENSIFNNDQQGYYTSDFYVAGLLNTFHIDYYNTLNLNSTNHDLNFIKSITVTLIVEGPEGIILQEPLSNYAPGYYLQESGSVNNSDSSVNFNQSIELDYAQFTTRFNQIKNELSNITCTATIKINYIISCSGTLNNEKYSYQETMSSTLPVMSVGGLVSIDHVYKSNSNLEKNINTYDNHINYAWLSLAIIFDIIALILLAILIYALSIEKHESAKERYVNKMLNNYQDLIVYSNEIPTEGKQIIKLENFMDIIKAETELSTPIVCNHKDSKYKFYVLSQSYIYYFEYDTNN